MKMNNKKSNVITVAISDIMKHGNLREMFIEIPEDTARNLIGKNLQRISNDLSGRNLKANLYDMLLDEIAIMNYQLGVRADRRGSDRCRSVRETGIINRASDKQTKGQRESPKPLSLMSTDEQ